MLMLRLQQLQKLASRLAANMDESLLSKIPSEIRNAIYELLLPEAVETCIAEDFWKGPSLLQVCRKVREEAGPMYYSGRTFTLVQPVVEGVQSDLCRWLKLSDQNFGDASEMYK